MTDKVKAISKMMICYQLMWMTKDRTKPIEAARSSLKVFFRKVLTNQEEVYKEAEKYQIELYDEAWNLTFKEGEGQMLEVGKIVALVYQSIDGEAADKMIGRKKMEKALTSYDLAREDEDDALIVETKTFMFAEKIIQMYDGKKELSAFERRMIIILQNRIIEGKNNEDYKKEFTDVI